MIMFDMTAPAMCQSWVLSVRRVDIHFEPPVFRRLAFGRATIVLEIDLSER